MISKIERGDISNLKLEHLQQFLQVYPSEVEISAMKKEINRHGLSTFEQALNELECGTTEKFILQLLTLRSGIKRQAEILSTIVELGPMTTQLFSRYQAWIDTKNVITDNNLFQLIIAVTSHLLSQINEQKVQTGFDLNTLSSLFDVKSNLHKEKCAYHFVLKMVCLHLTGDSQELNDSNIGCWVQTIPDVIFDLKSVELMKAVVPHQQIVAQLNKIETMRNDV